jgi:dethiobiotin synthetase
MTKSIFITATDTDAGKTYCTALLSKTLVDLGYRVAVFKPISAGCEFNAKLKQLVNSDAAMLQTFANCKQTLAEINPIKFAEPIAPHIAAKKMQEEISLTQINQNFQHCVKHDADFILTEGAGGWRLPLGQGNYLSDFAKSTQQDVILVVNMKLGCLNHAILTYQSILSDGLNCVGWIANVQQEMPYLEDNIAELEKTFHCPRITTLSYQPDITQVNCKLNLSTICR